MKKNVKYKKKETIFNKTGKWFSLLVLILPVTIWGLSYIGSNYYSVEQAFFSTNTQGVKNFTLSYFERFFVEIFAPDTVLNIAFANTMKYWILGIIKAFLALFISYFLYKKIRFGKVYTVIMFLPSIIAGTVYVSMFKALVDAPRGPLAYFLLDNFGVEIEYMFSEVRLATPGILFYTLWSGFGTQLLIYVGVMNRIPEDILEAEKLDGCGLFREFWSIIFPFTWATFTTFLITSFTGIFMSTGPILLFTGLQESDGLKTTTLNFYIYEQVQKAGGANYAAAMGIIISLATIPIVVLTRFLMNKYQSDFQF